MPFPLVDVTFGPTDGSVYMIMSYPAVRRARILAYLKAAPSCFNLPNISARFSRFSTQDLVHLLGGTLKLICPCIADGRSLDPYKLPKTLHIPNLQSSVAMVLRSAGQEAANRSGSPTGLVYVSGLAAMTEDP